MLFEESDMQDGTSPWNEAERNARDAWEHFESGRPAKALEALSGAIDLNPTNAAWRFDKALTLDALESYDEAIEEYKAALNAEPQDLEILNCLAVDYTRIRYYDLALANFNKIHKLAPHYEPAYCNSIITYAEMDMHEQAEEAFYIAQELDPNCPLCFYNIGNSLFMRREFGRAKWCWQKVESLDEDHPEINYRIAQACWAEGQLEQAREYFLRELRRNPAGLGVILDFGLFLLETGDINAAGEKFARITEFDPAFALAWLYLGEIAMHRGDLTTAIEQFRTAMKKNPSMCGPRMRLAGILALREHNVQAVQYLREELLLGPRDPEVLLAMASMLERLGQKELALSCVSRISSEAKSPAAWRFAGVLMARQGKFDDALGCLRRAMDMAPEDYEIMLNLAQVCIHNSDWRQAADLLTLLRKNTPLSLRLIMMSIRVLAGRSHRCIADAWTRSRLFKSI